MFINLPIGVAANGGKRQDLPWVLVTKFRGREVDEDPSPWLVDCWKVRGRACEEFDESRDELLVWVDDDDDDDMDDVWRSWIDLWSIELLDEEEEDDEEAKETGRLQTEESESGFNMKCLRFFREIINGNFCLQII